MYKSVSISFIIRKNRKRANGEVPIYLRIYLDGTSADLYTNCNVDSDSWNNDLKRVNGNGRKARSINDYLGEMEHEARDAQRQLLQEGAEITPQSVKARMTGQDKEEDKTTVLEVFEKHNSKMKSQIGNGYSEATYKKYRTAKKHVKNFLIEEFDDTDYKIADVDLDFLEEFAEYLMTKKNPCCNNSARKYLSNFQKVVNLALRKGLITVDPFKNFKMKYNKKDPEYLSHDELKRLEDTEMVNNSLDRVRDVFLFSCYTGLAFSDAKSLKRSDISRDKNDRMYLLNPRRKTGTNAMIMLLPQAVAIIEKYKDDPATKGGELLPMISNQKTNAYLKVVADHCNIDKGITHHMARHTFATTVALENDLPMEVLQYILGHRQIRQTEHYGRVLPSKVNSHMAKLSERLD